jgi:hypothetical protein
VAFRPYDPASLSKKARAVSMGSSFTECEWVLVSGDEDGSRLLRERDWVVVTAVGGSAFWLCRDRR